MPLLSTFLTTLLTIVFPILLIAAVAYGLGRQRIITDQRPLARIALYLFSPTLAFVSLARSNVSGRDLVSILTFAFLIAMVMAAIGLALARVLRFDRMLTSALLLSILFVNAGNFGLPFSQFAFGQEGLARAAIYFTANLILTNTLAVYIASAGHSSVGASMRAVFKMPLVYAAVLGLIFNAAHWTLPEPLARALDLAAAAAVPVMLVNLGLELARARLQDYDWRVLLAAGVKLLITPLVALGLAMLLGMEGLNRSVSVTEASMPTAVMASLIATEFRARSDYVTGVVFISTLGSTITLTVLLVFLGHGAT